MSISLGVVVLGFALRLARTGPGAILTVAGVLVLGMVW